jgi:hypothetical protein
MKSEITKNPDALYWATFNRFELRIPAQAVLEIAQSGPNDAAVAHWAPVIRKQMKADNFANRPTPAKIRAELAEFGAWDDAELADDAANWLRLVWSAAWNIAEDDAPDCSAPVYS